MSKKKELLDNILRIKIQKYNLIFTNRVIILLNETGYTIFSLIY